MLSLSSWKGLNVRRLASCRASGDCSGSSQVNDHELAMAPAASKAEWEHMTDDQRERASKESQEEAAAMAVLESSGTA